MNILLGLTGSVASSLHHKLYESLSKLGDVRIVMTQAALPFIDESKLPPSKGIKFGRNCKQIIFHDSDEWTWKTNDDENTHLAFGVPDFRDAFRNKYRKNDPVLHIDLCKWANVLVIAPCSANTLAKISYGFCDNLLCSIVRAWPDNFPLIIAPAMNTEMWDKFETQEQLERLYKHRNFSCINPISKKLACGDTGIGAMADIDTIVKEVQEKTRWNWPFDLLGIHLECPGIPVDNHPGSFGFQRKHSKHTGVDLYVQEGTIVQSMQPGKVLGIEHFTGPQDGSPWWLDTDCVLIESPSGVICYGEIEVSEKLYPGYKVKEFETIGTIKRVVKNLPKNPPYGHKPSMLHVELYDRKESSARAEVIGHFSSNGFDENLLRDPTPHLLGATGSTTKIVAINATGIV